MPIAALRIDDRLWDSAPDLRRADWRTSIVDLLDDAKLGAEEEHTLHVSASDDGIELVTFDEGGAVLSARAITHGRLKPHVDEYLLIIRRMQSEEVAESSSRMQSLDMAKKVVHDGGAKTLAAELPGFAPDHETYRRLFTLLLSVLVDVTRLGAGAHRRHLR
jgi:uncharacterized protein (UPF0262 family)